MARIELNEQDIEEVAGGAFHWYYDQQGARHCNVDGAGDYSVTPAAKDRYIALKLEHKLDGWTGADYAEVLVREGYFQPN